MTTISYNIPNINCNHCVHTIKTELEGIAGVQSVTGDVNNKTVQIVFESPATEDQIQAVLKEINYPMES